MRRSGSLCSSVWASRSPRPPIGPRSGSSPRFFMIPWPQNYYCLSIRWGFTWSGTTWTSLISRSMTTLSTTLTDVVDVDAKTFSNDADIIFGSSFGFRPDERFFKNRNISTWSHFSGPHFRFPLFFSKFPAQTKFFTIFKLNRTQKMEHCSPGNGASSQCSHFPLCCNGIPISTWKIKGNNFFQECLFFRIMGLSSNFFFSWHDFAKKLGSTKTILRRLSRTRPVWGKFQGYGATMGKLHHHV